MISSFPHSLGPPSEESLALTLGSASSHWQALVALLEQAANGSGTWRSYGLKYGWRLDFRQGTSPLAGVYPTANGVLLGINLRVREWTPAFDLDLGPVSRSVLEASEPLRDGRFLLLPIGDAQALQDAALLIRLKTAGSRRS